METPIVRGELHFFRNSRGNVECYFGDPKDPESEFILEVHVGMLDDLIAGLTAIRAVRK